MRSSTTPAFWKLYADLPSPIQRLALKSYGLWPASPDHPSLQFKKAGLRSADYDRLIRGA